MLFKGKLLAEAAFVFMLATLAVCSIEVEFVIPVLVAASVMLLVFIAASGAVKNKIVLKHILCVLGAVIAASGYFSLFYNINEKPVLGYPDIYDGTETAIKARINKVKRYSFYTQLDLNVTEVNGEKISKNFKLELFVYGMIYAEIDDIIETKVIFDTMEASEAAYSKSNGYYISAEHFEPTDDPESDDSGYVFQQSYKVTSAESHGFFYYINRLQEYTRDVFLKNVRWDENGYSKNIKWGTNIINTNNITQEAALVYGIFAGRTDYIETYIKTDFNRTGISHTFSVSGLHLSIITGIIYSFLRMLKIHKKTVCVIVILCCLIFMAFSGLSLSVVRSGIMTVLYYFAFLFSRKNDSFTSLCVAGVIICLISPYNILNIGFQLSFLATLGIVLTSGINSKIAFKIPAISLTKSKKPSRFGKKLREKLRTFLRASVSSLLVTVAATIFTLPVTSYSFKTLSLISPVVNLITSPFTTLILTFSLLITTLSFIPAVTFILGVPLYFLSKAVLNISSFFSSMKYASISVSSTKYDMFSLISLIFFIIVILFFVVYSKNKVMNIVFYSLFGICVTLMCANLIYVRYIFKDSLRAAYYSDYTNQSIILFQDDYDKADIIDITHGTKSLTYGVRDIILDNGATSIGSLVLTHYHLRHTKMLERLMNYFTIDRVFVPSPKTDYDKEVFESLFNFSVNGGNSYKKNYELFMYNDGILDLNDTTIIVNAFDYDSIRHMTVDIWSGESKLMYLGMGYGNIYSYIENVYDIVFYGTHRHNRQDNDYSADIYGLHYGVLSDYIDGFGNRSTQRLGENALKAYDFDGDSQLIYSGESDEFYPVFEITEDNELFYYRRRK